SGDQLGAEDHRPSTEARTVSVFPSAVTTRNSALPSRNVKYATRLPSGDQAGAQAPPGPFVSRTSSFPLGQMRRSAAVFSRMPMNSNRRPSGDQDGDNPRTTWTARPEVRS